ncbi:MAG: hypothetical protein Q4B26_16430, partial [Eubacteriales bacterium]|nr:hypothetical protein [Eubacteriales bacterium]
GTRILEVTVVADTPTEAKQIVDTLCRRGANEITKAMGFQQVNLYEYGTMDNVPCNTMQVQRIVLYGLIAAILVYAVFLVLYLLDDSLETDESIEQQLGLKILGRIPSAQSVAGRRSYSYGSRRKK